MHVDRVSIPLRVGELRGNYIVAVGQERHEIKTIIIVVARLRDGYAIESEATKPEQRVEKIIVHGRVVSRVHILPRTRNQFTSDIEVDIEINIGIVGRYKKFLIIYIYGGLGLYAVSIVSSTDLWPGLCAKMSKSLLTDANFSADMM